jgi:ABC-type antimicrobial peptide transport system permease subunit
VVRDNLASQSSVLLVKPGPELYRPFRQSHFWLVTFYARPAGQARAVQKQMEIAAVRLIPHGRPTTLVMSTRVDRQIQSVRTNARQIAGFAVVGLFLALTGLHGALSYLVQQRTQEIGIRGVLGAGQRQILGMVLGQALRFVAAGIVLGMLVASLAMRSIEGILYGTPPADPSVYAAVACIFLILALAASYLPARRATRVDPAIALRTA